jgi:hypothetical protein
MLNEGKGISDVIKEDVDKIYQLFLDNFYLTHNILKKLMILKTNKEIKIGFKWEV